MTDASLDPPRQDPPRQDRRRWRLALAAWAGPVLALGFAASAVANRVSFALWGLILAGALAWALHGAWESRGPGEPGRSPGRGMPAGPTFVLAVGLSLFAALLIWPVDDLTTPGELLALGLAALIPGLSAGWIEVLTGPRFWVLASLGLIGVAASRARFRGRSPSVRPPVSRRPEP